MFLSIVCMLFVFSVALAASYEGSIWTGKPNALGLGYYCTAAQNKSQGDVSTHWAKAKTWTSSSASPVSKSASGNERAVASTGSVHPYKGWGSYGETANGKTWSTEGNFKSSAWD